MDGKYKILLTADAGIEALSRSYKYLKDVHSYVSGSMKFMQISHHGSRHNVNTVVLNKILGEKIPENDNKKRGSSVASVAKEASDYPKKVVTNAFITRGFLCSATKGENVWHHKGNMPKRSSWGAVTPIEYADEVEALDE